MATVDYAGVAVEVAAAIAEVGQVGAIKRTTAPDPILGGDGTTTSYPATLVPMTYDARYVNGTTIISSDRQIYVSSIGLAIVPAVGDVVTAGGVDYRIVATDPQNYDGVTNVVYILQGRIDA
jgi:hypothetical protein